MKFIDHQGHEVSKAIATFPDGTERPGYRAILEDGETVSFNHFIRDGVPSPLSPDIARLIVDLKPGAMAQTADEAAALAIRTAADGNLSGMSPSRISDIANQARGEFLARQAANDAARLSRDTIRRLAYL